MTIRAEAGKVFTFAVLLVLAASGCTRQVVGNVTPPPQEGQPAEAPRKYTYDHKIDAMPKPKPPAPTELKVFVYTRPTNILLVRNEKGLVTDMKVLLDDLSGEKSRVVNRYDFLQMVVNGLVNAGSLQVVNRQSLHKLMELEASAREHGTNKQFLDREDLMKVGRDLNSDYLVEVTPMSNDNAQTMATKPVAVVMTLSQVATGKVAGSTRIEQTDLTNAVTDASREISAKAKAILEGSTK